ncbi:hypothetical protein [Streptomyces sp. NBC_00459]|uniref:hypothetical protein n=1 Tax=Streptomyces sp. NBC_00459 TaxID=2975749 RepID=UPI002E18756A
MVSVRNTTRILGPTTAGLLTASVGGGWVIGADTASFLLAATFFARMSLPDLPPRTDGDPTMLGEPRQGWGLVLSARGVGALPTSAVRWRRS